MDPYGTSFLREKWGSFQVEAGVPPGRKIAIHSYTYVHIFYVYIYTHMFQSSKFILSHPKPFLLQNLPHPPTPRSSVLKTGTLRHQNAMQHLANALDAEVPTSGGRCLVGSVATVPPLVGWPGNECRRCLGGLEILHLGGFFVDFDDGLRDKNVERLFVDQKPTKDYLHLQLLMTFVFFFPVFCWKNSETGDL